MIYSGKNFVSYGADQDFEEIKDDDDYDDDYLDEDDRFSDPRVHSELISLKEMHNYSQEVLKSTSIYMLDYESEVFLWIGKDVSRSISQPIFKALSMAITATSPKGMARMRKISIALVL